MMDSDVPPMLKIPAARVPQAPQTPCTEMAPTGSSTRILSKNSTEKTTSTPATAPMMMALPGVTVAQRAGDGHQSGQGAVEAHADLGFAEFDPGGEHGQDAPAAAARLVLTKIMAMSLLAAVVEPGLKPNHPSQRMKTPRAASGMLWPRIGLTRAVLGVFAHPGAQNDGAGQSGPAADGVDHRGTGEIDEAESFQPAAAVEEAAPGPAAENRVDEGADDDTVDQISGELGPFGHGAGYDGGGRGGEDHLEHPEGQHPGIAADVEVAQKKAGGAEPAGGGGTEHQPETDGPEGEGAHGKIHQVFHHDVDGVLGPREAGLHHGKPGLHEKDQGGRHQGPHVIRVGLHQVDGRAVGFNRERFVSGPGQGEIEDEKQQGKNDFFHGGQCLLPDVMR